jgi:hypothetical protein
MELRIESSSPKGKERTQRVGRVGRVVEPLTHMALGGRDVWERFTSWKLEQLKNPLASEWTGSGSQQGGTQFDLPSLALAERFGRSSSGTRSGQTWTEGMLVAFCRVVV